NYLASDVFKRVTAAHRVSDETVNSEFGIRNSKLSAPGLWSELRFRLRRRLGILTGTIDKLLITPAAGGDGVDVEIIDFKTNRFQSWSKPGARQAKTAGPATAHSRERVVTAGVKEVRGQSAQGFFNFESAPEEVS